MPRDDLPIACQRIVGGSVRDCRCMLPNEGGFLECPEEARGGVPVSTAALVVMLLAGELLVLPPAEPEAPIATPPENVVRLVRPAEKRVSGYTGDLCQTCGSADMVRTGTCLTCQRCGDSSGGCS